MTTLSVHIPVIETERLRLRAPMAGDLPAFLDFVTSDRATFVGGPMEAADGWRMFATIIGHWALRGHGLFVATQRDTGRPVGSAGILSPEGWPEPELAWHIWDATDEGKGFAQEAARAVRHWWTGQGHPAPISLIDPENHRSRRLAERMGAAVEGEMILRGSPCLIYRHPKEAA